MRITIGEVKAWSIERAQAEARRLKVLIDQGNDPREVRADQEAAKEAKAAALKLQKVRASVTLGMHGTNI